MTWQTIRTLTTQAAEGSAPLAAVFVVHPEAGQFSTSGGRLPFVEIGFDSLTLAGSPTAVTLAVWRLTEGKIEKLFTTTILAADIGVPTPLDVEVDAEALWVTVDSFTGGTVPTLSGSVRFRPSRSGAARPVQGIVQSVSERYAPEYEDNTAKVAATSRRFLPTGVYSPTSLAKNFGANVTANAKASPGVVTAILGDNANAAVRYLQIHNTATTPAGGAVPVISIRVPATSSIMVGEDILSENGLFCSTGIAYAWSTAAGTYVAATAADHNTQVWGV